MYGPTGWVFIMSEVPLYTAGALALGKLDQNKAPPP